MAHDRRPRRRGRALERGDAEHREDAAFPELGRDAVLPELSDEPSPLLPRLGLGGRLEDATTARRRGRGRLLVGGGRRASRAPAREITGALAALADLALGREVGDRLDVAAGAAALCRRRRGGEDRLGLRPGPLDRCLHRCRRPAVPPRGELPLDELVHEARELRVDLLADQELELGLSFPDGSGDDLGELHDRSLRPGCAVGLELSRARRDELLLVVAGLGAAARAPVAREEPTVGEGEPVLPRDLGADEALTAERADGLTGDGGRLPEPHGADATGVHGSDDGCT